MLLIKINKIKINETVSKLLTTIGLKSKSTRAPIDVPVVSVEEVGITGVDNAAGLAAPIDMEVDIETISEEASLAAAIPAEHIPVKNGVSGYDGTIYTGAFF